MLALIFSLAAAQGPCSIEGKVTLSHQGESISARDKVVVYIESAGAFEARRAPKTWQIFQRDYDFDPRVLPIVIGDIVFKWLPPMPVLEGVVARALARRTEQKDRR